MLDIIKADGNMEYAYISKHNRRGDTETNYVERKVKSIINKVKTEKDKAVKKYNKLFDGVNEIKILNKDDFYAAYQRVSEDFRTAITLAAKNIEEFHKNQLQKGFDLNKNGSDLGQIIRPLRRAGIYVPGGRAPYPSTVLMNAIPAKIAGVKEIVIFSPPANGKNDNILAAAYVAGADEMVLAGGAHGVAAAAYGTETIKFVDKIVGPGNIYVATAKQLVYGVCDIDMIAGPSEILIIADKTANPAYIAADLMSQAEHDPLASSIFLTDSMEIAQKTLGELEKQIENLDRSDIIKESFFNHGIIIVCKNLDQMIELSNLFAPEHLELLIDNPKSVLPRIENAGSIFLGEYSPEPLGDYFAGTNHVLPTSGSARFFSPLSVDSFIKKMQYIYYTKEELTKSAEHIIKLAETEGFSAHANSIKVRLK